MQDLEPEVRKSSARTSKRAMAVALRGQDEPARITRQRTRELALVDEVPTADPQVGSTEDALMLPMIIPSPTTRMSLLLKASDCTLSPLLMIYLFALMGL